MEKRPNDREDPRDCNPMFKSLPAEVTARRRPQEKGKAGPTEAALASVDAEQVLQKKPDGRFKWLQKGLQQAQDGRLAVQGLYDIISCQRYGEDLTDKVGRKMYRLLHANLDAFSSKQRKTLERDCSLARLYAATAWNGKAGQRDGEEENEAASGKLEDMMARCRAFVRDKQHEDGEGDATNAQAEEAEDGTGALQEQEPSAPCSTEVAKAVEPAESLRPAAEAAELLANDSLIGGKASRSRSRGRPRSRRSRSSSSSSSSSSRKRAKKPSKDRVKDKQRSKKTEKQTKEENVEDKSGDKSKEKDKMKDKGTEKDNDNGKELEKETKDSKNAQAKEKEKARDKDKETTKGKDRGRDQRREKDAKEKARKASSSSGTASSRQSRNKRKSRDRRSHSRRKRQRSSKRQAHKKGTSRTRGRSESSSSTSDGRRAGGKSARKSKPRPSRRKTRSSVSSSSSSPSDKRKRQRRK